MTGPASNVPVRCARGWHAGAVRRPRVLTVGARSLVAGLLALTVVACGDDGGPVSSTTEPTPTVAGPAPVPTVDGSTPSTPSTPSTEPTLPDTIATAELGYPRDLLDRGRVNIVVTRAGDVPFVVHRHQLHVEGFEPAPAEDRRIVVPPDGQRVAIQARFGEVVACDAPAPPAAALAVDFSVGDDPTVHSGTLELDDTDTLTAIRARFCTARRVLAENDVVLGEPTLDGETFTLDLQITRRAGDAELVIDAIQGTVLFGVESPFAQGAAERTLAPGTAELVLPLTFDVNRCDPHAVAETTRKKGLTLWIAVDGAEPQPVDVDIAAIDADLEEILDRCKARTGQ